HPGRVARSLQRLRDGDFVQREFSDVVHGPQGPAWPLESVNAADGVNAGARTVLPAHQSGARGLAIRAASVAVREAHALRGQTVNVRCLVKLAAVAGHVRVAEIVGQNEDDVRFGRGVCGEHGHRETGQSGEKFHYRAKRYAYAPGDSTANRSA